MTKQDWAVSLTHCGHGQHVRDRTACVFIVLPLHVCESCIPNLGQGWEQGLVSFETLTNGLVMKESTREKIYIYIYSACVLKVYVVGLHLQFGGKPCHPAVVENNDEDAADGWSLSKTNHFSE